MKTILITGDSLAADWSVKYKQYKGWPTLLAEQFTVTNLAQAGVSEYKIYQQVESVRHRLDDFDIIIINHTSPFRVPTISHPLLEFDEVHGNADLIYSDISYHAKKLKHFFNKSLRAAKNFFDHHYDIEFFRKTSELYVKEINEILKDKNVITLNDLLSIEHHHYDDYYRNNTESFLNKHKGSINHLTEEGNKLVFDKLIEIINRIS